MSEKTGLNLMIERIAEIAPSMADIKGPQDVTIEHLSNLAWALDLYWRVDLLLRETGDTHADIA